MLGSVVAGGRVVAVADDSDPYYVIDHDVTTGDRVGPEDVRVVQVRLGAEGTRYLTADRPLPDGLIARRSSTAGELVAVDAVGSSNGLDVRPVAVSVETRLPSSVRKGALVDVWVSDPDPSRSGAFASPRPLVQGAVVAELQTASSSLGSASGTTVQVLVATDDLPAVLEALANQGVVSVLPAVAP